MRLTAARRALRGGDKYLKSKQSIAAPTHKASPATLIWGLSPRETAILAGILLATAAIYLPSLRNGWVWDDWMQIVRADPLHSWTGIGKSFIYDAWWFWNPARLPQSAYYRPLQATWIGLNYMILGNHPAAWHLEKIAIELIGVMLCFRLAQLLTRSSTAALLTAGLFGLLAANAESVVWASAIVEPLATIFEMGALCCFIKREPGWSRGLFSALILYACATLTHESAILFPLIVAAYVFLFDGRDQRAAVAAQSAGTIVRIVSALRACAPFVAVAIAYMCARVNALGFNCLFGMPYNTTALILRGFEVSKPPHSPAQVLMTLPAALITYLAVLAIPAMAGPTHAVEWAARPAPIVFISGAALVLLAAAAFALAWRSSNRRVYAFCAVWGLLTIAPALNLNALLLLVEDRYLYAPSFGWSLAVAITALSIAAAGPRARKAVGAAMAVLLALYAASAIQMEHYWRDDVTFFQRCVEIAPHKPSYRCQLAGALNEARDFKGAAQQLERATTLAPDDPQLHLKLAQQYRRMGRQLDFEREFQKFTELSYTNSQRALSAQGARPSQPAAAP